MGRPHRYAGGDELIMPDTKKRGFRTTLSHTGRNDQA